MTTDTLTHPHDIGAERALLGTLIEHPELLREVEIDARDIWREDHRRLFQLMQTMQAEGEPINLVTLPERVARTGKASSYGGVGYVIELPEHAAARDIVGHYARRIRDTADHRKLMELGRSLVVAASSQAGDPGELAQTLRGQLAAVGGGSAADWVSMADAVQNARKGIEKRAESGTGISGAPSGFYELDRLLSGFCGGKLYLIAARPAMGKTALALQVAEGLARDVNSRGAVGIFSMEMDAAELAERTVTGVAGIQGERARSGRLMAEEWDRLLKVTPELAELMIFIQDRPARTLADIVKGAHLLEAQCGGLQALVIDYLQLMQGDGETQALRIGAISAGLKALARELDVPVILLSQLNRDCEKRQDKRPLMADIRDSGSVEQDCDVILFIYRDEVYNPETRDAGVAEVICRKQRNGPTGTVRLGFKAGRFSSNTGASWS